MKLIESKTLATAAASIEFTSIPQDGTDLVLVISARTNRSTDVDDGMNISLNSSTTGFSTRFLYGYGTTVASGTDTRWIGSANSNGGSTSNTFNNSSIYFTNYTAATNKSYSIDSVSENNGTLALLGIWAGLWSNTAAITSITISPITGPNFVAGTMMSLYKITKGSDGIVTTSP